MADAQSQPTALALSQSVKFAIQHRDGEIERLTTESGYLHGIIYNICGMSEDDLSNHLRHMQDADSSQKS